MAIRRYLLFFFVLVWAPHTRALDCADIYQDYFSGLSDDSRVREFLELRARITLQRLAYQRLRSMEEPAYIDVQGTILGLLAQLEAQRDPAFLGARAAFERHELSFASLARIMPDVVHILRFQNVESNVERRRDLSLNTDDLKIFDLLGRLETQQGVQGSGLLASVRATNLALARAMAGETSSAVLAQNLELSQGEMRRLLATLPFPDTCLSSLRCGLEEDAMAGRSFLDQMLQRLDPPPAFEDWTAQIGALNLFSPGDQVACDTTVPAPMHAYMAPGTQLPAGDLRRLTEAVARRVLDTYPSYFPNLDYLLVRPELTLAIGDALYHGRSYFVFQSREFYLPRVEGNLPSREDLPQNQRPFALANERLLNERHPSVFDQGIRNHIEFRRTWVALRDFSDQRGTFAFNGEAYDLETGTRVRPGPSVFFTYPRGDAPRDIQYLSSIAAYPPARLREMADRGSIGQRTFFDAQGAYFITGTAINPQREIPRYVAHMNRLSTLSDAPGEQRISREDLEGFIARHPESRHEIIASIGDRAQALVGGNEVFRPRIADPAQRIVSSDRALTLVRRNIDPYTRPAFDRQNRATVLRQYQALVSGRSAFFHEGRVREVNDTMTEDEINALPTNLERIQAYHRYVAENPCPYYTVVHKAALPPIMRIHNNAGEKTHEWEVLVGAERGDTRTWFLSGTSGERNYRSERTNRTTGVGVFTSLGYVTDDPSTTLDDYYNDYGWQLMRVNTDDDHFQQPANTTEVGVVMAIHAVPASRSERLRLFYDGNPRNNRASNGCVNMLPEEFLEYRAAAPLTGCPIYVLPDGDEATSPTRFQVQLGTLVTERNPSAISPIPDNNTDWYISRDPRREPVRPIYVNLLTPNPGNADFFLQTLAEEKANIMRIYGISNEDYDRLIALAYAILGVETAFGTSRRYHAKEQLQLAITAGRRLAGSDQDNSRGLTQIKDVRRFLDFNTRGHPITPRPYPEITEDTLGQPRDAAIATMVTLARQLREMRGTLRRMSSQGRPFTAITPENEIEFLYYMYNGDSDQITNRTATRDLNPRIMEIIDLMSQVQVIQRVPPAVSAPSA